MLFQILKRWVNSSYVCMPSTTPLHGSLNRCRKARSRGYRLPRSLGHWSHEVQTGATENTTSQICAWAPLKHIRYSPPERCYCIETSRGCNILPWQFHMLPLLQLLTTHTRLPRDLKASCCDWNRESMGSRGRAQ